ncbi:MAG: TIGR01777 family oxidoreductase [Candidatus Melainabacteria bacterium]|nr:TIGR01777 family oxidoreductase [Candidatus Melainabacteria bacterium]
MKIAIAGATGLVGKELTKYLTSKGHEVSAIRREGSPEAPYPQVTPDYLEQFDALINLAGENIAAGRWTDEQKKKILDSRVNTTRALVTALNQTKNKPTVFINTSAIGIYGNRGADLINEESSAGKGFLADVCRAWEAEANKAQRQNLRVAIARFGVVLDPKGGALNKMLLPFKMGAGGILGDGRQYMSWIGMHDLVRAIEYILETDSLIGPINMTAPNPATNQDFTSALGHVLHRPTIFPAPAFVLNIVLGQMAQEMLLEGSRVMPDQLTSKGFKFDYPNLENALKHEIEKS